MAKRCEGCHYWRKFDAASYACHYCLDTGEPRGGRAENCTKYVTDSEYVKSQKEFIYAKVYWQHRLGSTVTTIAKSMRLPPNTIKKIIREMKEKNETPND